MDLWLENPGGPHRKGPSHNLKNLNRPRRSSQLAVIILSLVFLLVPLGNGCGKEAPEEIAGPADGSPPRAVPHSLVPGAGEMHNRIVENTLAVLPELFPLSEDGVSSSRFRGAFRTAAREAFAQGWTGSDAAGTVPELEKRLDTLLDDEHLDLLERRFRELKALLTRAELPPPGELEALFASWGIGPEDARRAARFAELALSLETNPEAGGTVVPVSKLRELGASSPTLGMVYELYCSSASLWQEVAAQSSFKEEKLELILTIVMDAEGGLGGLLFGPIGAILGSAAYSILWVATAP